MLIRMLDVHVLMDGKEIDAKQVKSSIIVMTLVIHACNIL